MSAQGYVPAVLADLESRAGASDKDRDLWLAERRSGITATEVRDLAAGKIRTQDLIDLKLGRTVDSFTGNAFTQWGKDRESVVAEVMSGEGFREESRVFHHPDNSRYLASPDGIRIDFDENIDVLEIKTAGYDLPPGSVALREKGYALQVQWVMFVIGARRGRFVVEERIGHPREGFMAGDLFRHWIERDDDVIKALRFIADEFLAELDKQREEGAPEIDEHVDTLAVNYLRGLAAEKEGKALKESSYRQLVEAGVSQKSELASVTFTPGKPGVVDEVEEVDLEAAAKARPDEFARMQEVVRGWNVIAAQFTKKVVREKPGTKAKVTVRAVTTKQEKAA